MSILQAQDKEFIASFENCSIGRECWTHSAHVRMAWIQLRRFGTFAKALKQIKTGIRRFNSQVNSIGYHETLTVAFTRLIHARMAALNEEQTWDDFQVENPDVFSKNPYLLNSYYSDELLAQEQSKINFVAPDKKPLPPIGAIRFVQEDDADELLSIYAYYVRHTPISFEYKAPSLVEFKQRIREITASHPWLVFESEGAILGYAYATKHRAREAYQWSTEVSAYVSMHYHRLGIARLLYANLFRRLNLIGFHSALAGITLPNDKSVGFHEAMGFEPIGVYRSVGFKMGKWHDVGWWQKFLRPRLLPPSSLKNFSSK